MAKHLLLTGPVNGLDAYAEAARLTGWQVTEELLIEVRHLDLDAERVFAATYQWVAVTSSNALPALSGVRRELAETPVACVGERTAERLAQLGLRVALGPAADASELARLLCDAVRPEARASTRILWPHGSLANELGERLSNEGFVVDAALAYETTPRRDTAPLPEADAIFFASPSAVQRYIELVRFVDREPPLAIAIGETTLRALKRSARQHFASFERLDKPNPTELGAVLAQLSAAED